MVDITSALKKIQVEETKFGSAVSEATMTKIGSSVNAIIDDFRNIPITCIEIFGIDELYTEQETVTTTSQPQWARSYSTLSTRIPYNCTIVGIDIACSSYGSMSVLGNSYFVEYNDFEMSLLKNGTLLTDSKYIDTSAASTNYLSFIQCIANPSISDMSNYNSGNQSQKTLTSYSLNENDMLTITAYNRMNIYHGGTLILTSRPKISARVYVKRTI